MAYFIGKGFTLTIGGTLIGQVVSWSGPEMSFGIVETTHMGSTFREKLGTIQDSGSAEFIVNWDPETAGSINHPTLLSTFKAGAAVTLAGDIQLVGVGADVITSATAILTGFRVQGVTVDSVWQVAVSVEFTGDVTLA